jgi:hypothetical protein
MPRVFTGLKEGSSHRAVRRAAIVVTLLLIAALLVFQQMLLHIDKLTHHALFYALVVAAVAASIYGVAKPSMDYSSAFEEPPPDAPNYRAELNARGQVAEKYKRENAWKSELALLLCVVLMCAVGVLTAS